MARPVIRLRVNGAERETPAEPQTPLLYVLRNDFELKAAKFGCGLGQCGTCTVLVDGRPLQSCDVPLWSIAGKSVETLEHLRDSREGKALQEAFVGEQAAQCGYCIPGILVSATALLRETRSPDDAQIAGALSRSLCRCGTHVRILRAIRRAADTVTA